MTDADGGYLFDGLVAGNYRVTVDPASTVTSPYDAAVTSTLGVAMNPTYDRDGTTVTPNGVTEVTLTTGQSVTDVDFGYRWGGSIGDFVWYDGNYNGVPDSGDGSAPGSTGCTAAPCGAPNATLVLYYDSNGDGQVGPGEPIIGVYVTGNDGLYLFDNLPPGDYTVYMSEQEIPSPVSGVVNTMVTTTGDNQAVTLNANQAYNDADFGVAETARVEGTLFHDVNNNGVLDGGDIVLPAGVVVTLTGVDINGDPVSLTTTTDANGEYLFLVPPGDYTITYDPDDAAIPNPLQEANGGAETTPLEIKLTVLPGVEYGDNNFGRNYDGSVGDRVWNDADGNGAQDAGELGIPGVTVSLYAADGVTLLATKVTDDFGNYLFEGLADGTYVVKVNPATLPAGFVQTYDNAGGLDHSGQGVVIGGVADLTVDFGYEPDTSYTVSGTIWDDNGATGGTAGNGAQDGAEPGIENVTVCLYDDNGDLVACTETDGNGDYSFPGVPNGDYTIEVVTSTLPSTAYVQTGDPDATLDNKTSITVAGGDVTGQDFGYQEQLGSISGAVCVGSGDGLCDDPGDTPVENVTVTLTWAGEDGIFGNADDDVFVDVTDASGAYSFPNLQPGLYTITKVNPAGYTSLADADGFSADLISLSLGVGEDRANQDFEVQSTASIGDRIWLDEDGDGVQDAGEAGIANVTVQLYAADGTTLLATTTTDSNGNYIFAGLTPDDYVVKVDTTSMPAGLAANPTYDEDGVVTAHETEVTLASGETYTTADFGYNWVPATHSDNPPAGATGAIGDRVWIDANGDGVQDPGEPGLGGVPVAIFYDPDGDGIYDTPYTGAIDQNGATGTGTTTTEPDGSYVFDNLPPGAYVIVVNGGSDPAGYTQTGDPDGTLDNQTTQPVILAPGDVYVNADFGYEPAASSTIGDLIYLDLDGDGTHDAGEPGIAGVTVALLDENDNVIATTTTDAAGNYSFPGLPAGDYTVWVNDTANVLGQLDQTGDPDATLDSRHTLTVDGTSDYLDNDFGYAPPGHILGDGLIGDTIFLDRNGDGLFDAGEGLQGVMVELYNETGTTLLATTVTDANGNYYFGGLNAGTYVVKVDTASLPNGGTGLTNTVDPDTASPGDSQSTVILGGVDPMIDLDQDFGYEAAVPNTISGTIWNDTDADGTLDGPEAGRYEGVTVVLRDADGNVVATTTTDANGEYEFIGLPDGSYTVDVTDDANVLNGLWHSEGTAGTPGQSQSDPYTVAVSGGNTYVVDYGYYGEPASLGNWVWFDVNQNGIQDGGELGIPGVEVTLLVEYPNGDSVTVVTTTDANGYYSFGNLLLDESFNASGSGDPTSTGLPRYTISAATPPGYAPTLIGVGGDGAVDSNDPAGAVAVIVQGQDDVTYDFGFQGTASIGDRVWLDEDGDGVQDAGEAGIANLTVTLTGNDAAGNPVSLTTVTDANGGYLFTGLPPSGVAGYTITVAPTTGLNATYNEDTGTTAPDNATTVVLAAGVTHTTADFGYNWAPSSDVQNGTGTGAIGDRVWIDADGDGVQDPGETGLGGVTVAIYYDSDGNGTYDALVTGATDQNGVSGGTTTTEPDGSYVFHNLPAGAYEVRVTQPSGYTQTGDPDGILDNRTTTPVILAPGDVYVNADFGYQPTNVYNVSGSVYLDGNANGTRLDEPGIAGVTVNLVDSGGNIIATATTDANGNYTFTGVPNGNYTVVVGDTANVLAQLQQSGDPDAVLDGQTPVTVAGASVSGLDFGYTPQGHEAGDGLIGDTIFLDRAGDGFDVGEGLEGVTVGLYDATGTTLLATTVTDANGNYYFGGLDPATYVVKVDTATLPNGGTGLTNTVDPDAGTAHQSTVTLTAGEIDLLQDFGYEAAVPNTISGTIWNDASADGTLDASEAGRYEGVTVVLRDADGNIVATTTTNASGNFSFGGLPDGTYTVDVTDEANVLNGLWHSDGPNDGDNNNSQVDPYSVTVSGGETDETADFGYYGAPAALGNRVWNDSSDKNGIQNAGEPSIDGVKVTLTIRYFNAAPVTVVTVTGDDPSMAGTQAGWYSFGNLLLDENHASSTTGTPTASQPVYTISVETPLGYFATLVGQGSNRMVDSDDHAGVDGLATQGQTNVKQGGGLLEFDPVPASESNPIAGYDFGFSTTPPLAVLLAGFEAAAQPDHVLVTWETVSEMNNAGFNLYRSLAADGERTLLGWVPSQAPGSTVGAAYSFQDFDVLAGQGYWYFLEDVDLSGAATLHGPVSAVFLAPTAVALSALDADAGQGALPWLAVLAVLMLAAAATVVVNRRRVTVE
ncbi:MAG TPA: SdrD B-like domain-containing protein [Anaerolineae bacterium]|nr:SdrD B-like domain-containing protein [Anaerolineae bacterium]